MNRLLIILKGFFVGATMTVPGVSGGTMAVIMGIYEDLLSAINDVFKKPKEKIPVLLFFAVGCIAGFFTLAGVVTYLLENRKTGMIVRIVFAAIVALGIPPLVKNAELSKPDIKCILCVLAGAAVVVVLNFLPVGNMGDKGGILWAITQMLAGVIAAMALVLPGVSVTHMLYILGMYTDIMHKVYSMQIVSMIPFAIGFAVGIFATGKILQGLMENHKKGMYSTITGFVIGSVILLIMDGISRINV